MDAFGLLLSGLFSGMRVVAAGLVSSSANLNGVGSVAVVTSARGGQTVSHDFNLITPGHTISVFAESWDNGSNTILIIPVTFTGSAISVNDANHTVNAFILA